MDWAKLAAWCLALGYSLGCWTIFLVYVVFK